MPRLTLANKANATTAKVEPAVLLTICEAFNRRGPGCERVGGTLLGSREGNIVEVRSCYAVPLSEVGDQVGMDVMHHQTLFQLHRRVSPKDTIVGWFSSGYAQPARTDETENGHAHFDWISGTDNLINDFYAKNRDSGSAGTPVFLKVDTGFTDGNLGIKAYVSASMGLGSLQLGTDFQEVELDVQTTDLQKISGDVLGLTSGPGPAAGASADSLQSAVTQLSKYLDVAQQYCTEVAAGRREGSLALGRLLTDAVASMPRLTPAELGAAAAEDRQDMLLLLYLGQLVQTHLSLADHLGASALPLL